jgi:Tol biopolymer transport system component
VTDLVRGVATRLTFEPNIARSALWSTDGQTILYASNKSGVYALYQKPATGAGEPEFVARSSGLVMTGTDWSRDGRFVLYEAHDAKTSTDIWLLSMDGERKAVPLLHSPFDEGAARISPDGRWLAYHSDETGRFEIYLQSFPTLGNKIQISSGGGNRPQWRADGRELFYRGLDGSVMGVKIEAGTAFHADSPVRLFRLSHRDTGYSSAPDGQRFLFTLLEESSARLNPVIVVNWTALLKEK